MSFPAQFYSQLDNNLVHCHLCPHHCRIPDGRRGICFGRRNESGCLVTDNYGAVSGLATDPVEKKPLYHFLPGSRILSLGTVGCNLKCRFCQNWQISDAKDLVQLRPLSPSDLVRLALGERVPSVAFTYNEPIIFAEYVMDSARLCHEAGLKTVAVTAGYITSEARPEFFHDIDAANVDLKAFNEGFYRRLCRASLQPVLETLIWLKRETSVWVELTNLIIPGENDKPEEIMAMCDWIVKELGPEVPLHFSAFNPDHDMPRTAATPAVAVRAARDIAMTCGLRYVYTGNIRDAEGSLTRCPSCGIELVRREGWDVSVGELKEGKCGRCGQRISGIFE